MEQEGPVQFIEEENMSGSGGKKLTSCGFTVYMSTSADTIAFPKDSNSLINHLSVNIINLKKNVRNQTKTLRFEDEFD